MKTNKIFNIFFIDYMKKRLYKNKKIIYMEKKIDKKKNRYIQKAKSGKKIYIKTKRRLYYKKG